MRSLLHACLRGVHVALVSASIASAAWALPARAQCYTVDTRHEVGGINYCLGGNHNGRGRGDVGGTVVFFLIVTLFVVAKVWLDMNRRDPQARRVPPGTSPLWKQVDITRVRIALDADTRPFLQRELITHARRGDVSSSRGLHRLLVQVCRSLQVSESAWRYASVDNRQPMSTIFARTEFDKLAQDARAVFTQEVVHAANGKAAEGSAAGLSGSGARDGEGVIVVTLVVAAKCLITDVHILHVGALQRLLGALIGMSAEDVVALEVSWMPTDESVSLSKAALTKLFPRMTKLTLPAGQRICALCKGQHTTQSTNCPHSSGHVGSSTPPSAPRTAQGRIEAVRALRARGPKRT